VKIDENYRSGQTVHVLDASRSVTVVSNLLSHNKENFVRDVQDEYDKVRSNYAKKKGFKNYLSLADARANKFAIEWKTEDLKQPNFIGEKTLLDYDLTELRNYIDWTPFFHTWELRGKYPAIFEHETMGVEAKKLFEDAQKMLDQIIAEKWLTANAAVGIWPANSVDDDIEIYTDDTRQKVRHVQHGMRQQLKKAKAAKNVCVADFIAPKSSGLKDYVGGFVVTTGLGIEDKVKSFEADHDDYHSILLKALADRLAEAFAERLHEIVRQDLWGYEQEALPKEELIKETYRGIRPAPGYPANPDHTEKPGLFKLLNATELTGVSLTESMAMMPASSVSGWYFAHPEAHYFGVGKVTMEQVERLADSKGIPLERMKQWLSSNLED
jgi:5-methyltetrahydrofolate--homocysteine methyltransferase